MPTVYIGSRSTGATSGPVAADAVVVRPAALREAANLEAVGFYARSTVAGAKIRGLIYAYGSDGRPGALLGVTAELTATISATYYELEFAAPVALPAGNYFLGLHGGGATVSPAGNAPANLAYFRTAVAYGGGAPDPFGTPGGVSATDYHIYGRYTSDGTLDARIFGLSGGTGQTAIPANTARASRFTLAEAGTVARLTFQHVAGAGLPSARLRAMIYADTGTGAGALLATTDEQVGVWTMEGFDLWFPAPVALAAGSYYLAYHSDAELRPGYGAGTGPSVTASDAYVDGPANPFGSASPFFLGHLMIYAPYTPDVPPPPATPRVIQPVWIGL